MSDASCYEVGELLGEGGMGRVFRGRHVPSGQAVALKVLRSEIRNSGATRTLLQEAAAAARLDHPAIVDLLDLTWDPAGAPVLVMELVEGTNASAWLVGWPGWEVVVSGLTQVLEGLAAAHAVGVFHRDLKPHNLLIRYDGRVRIADFGVARVVDPLRLAHSAGRLVGTPDYMAPEQFAAHGDIGPWTDLYALGIIVWELVYGKLPFAGDLGQLVVQKRIGELPEHPPRPGVGVPDELASLLRRLLEPAPRARPRFASEVAAALATIRVDEKTAAAVSVASRLATTETRIVTPAHEPEGDAAHDALRPPVVPEARTGGPISETIESAETLIAVEAQDAMSGPTLHAAEVRPSEPPTRPPERFPAPPVPTTGGSLLRLRTLPVAGRAAHLERLEEAVARVCETRRAHVIALVGPAGVGKSKLARWAFGEVERRGLMVGTAAGYDLDGSGMEGGLGHAVSRLLGPSRDDWSWLGDEPEIGFEPSLMESWLGRTGVLPSSASTAGLVDAALRAVGKKHPVYLWLDDVGWADDGAVGLVEQLLEDDDVPVLVVCTIRSGTVEHPEVRGRLTAILGHSSIEVIEVEPLAREEVGHLLEAALPLRPGFRDALAGRIDATPLVALSQLYDWAEGGVLTLGPEGWEPAPGLDANELLASHGADTLFASRVSSFTDAFGGRAPDARGVLLRAAAIGDRFEESVVRAAAVDDDAMQSMIPAVLDRALLAGIIRYESGVRAHYQFDHGLLRQHLLDELARDDAHRDIARYVASAVEEAYGTHRPDVGARTSHLLWQAGDREPAIVVLLNASQQVARSGWFRRSKELNARGRDWLDSVGEPADTALRARVLVAQAETAYFASEYDEALSTVRRATPVVEAHGTARMRVRARTLEARILLYTDQHRAAERLANEVVAMVGPDDPQEWAADATHVLGEVATIRGDYAGARAHYEAHLAQTTASGSAWRQRFSLNMIAGTDLMLGDSERGQEIMRRVIREARAADDPHTLQQALDIQQHFDLEAERWDHVRDRAHVRLPVLLAEGDHWRTTQQRIMVARADAQTGNRDAALAAAEALLAAYVEVPHDEAFSHLTMDATIERLRGRGLSDVADRLHAALAARREAIERGLSEG